MRYEGNVPVEVTHVLVSTQHASNVSRDQIKEHVAGVLAPRVLGSWFKNGIPIDVNPTGSFVLGGPTANRHNAFTLGTAATEIQVMHGETAAVAAYARRAVKEQDAGRPLEPVIQKMNELAQRYAEHSVELRGCEQTRAIIDVKPATKDDWSISAWNHWAARNLHCAWLH